MAPDDAAAAATLECSAVDISSIARLDSNSAPPRARSRREMPASAVGVLRAWLAAHFAYPYPTPHEQAELLAETGIEKKQLKNWLTNARRRTWRPACRALSGAGGGGDASCFVSSSGPLPHFLGGETSPTASPQVERPTSPPPTTKDVVMMGTPLTRISSSSSSSSDADVLRRCLSERDAAAAASMLELRGVAAAPSTLQEAPPFEHTVVTSSSSSNDDEDTDENDTELQEESDSPQQPQIDATVTRGRSPRELPLAVVATLRAWLKDHFDHPYPTMRDRYDLMQATGLDEKQLKNWFTNARRRVWKSSPNNNNAATNTALINSNNNGKNHVASPAASYEPGNMMITTDPQSHQQQFKARPAPQHVPASSYPPSAYPPKNAVPPSPTTMPMSSHQQAPPGYHHHHHHYSQ